MIEPTLPPLNWLRAFDASARHLSFTAAAHELNMSQPAVSQHVKALETYLGLTLFIRRSRTLEITIAGKSYLPVVQEAFETLSVGTRALIGGDRGVLLTIQANLAFSVFWLSPRLNRLLDHYPWLTVNIVSAHWEPERTASASDVEVRFGLGVEEIHDCTRLSFDTCFPVCMPSLAGAASHSLHEHHLFDCSGMLGSWESWLTGTGRNVPRAFKVNNSSTYTVSLAAAQSGSGLAMAHETIASDLLARSQLAKPFEESIRMPEGYYLMATPKHAETPAIRAFRSWLLEEFDLETE